MITWPGPLGPVGEGCGSDNMAIVFRQKIKRGQDPQGRSPRSPAIVFCGKLWTEWAPLNPPYPSWLQASPPGLTHWNH